jgi:hypothetical protein
VEIICYAWFIGKKGLRPFLRASLGLYIGTPAKGVAFAGEKQAG